MAKLQFARLSDENLDEMIEVMARSRAIHPHERRLARGEARTLTLDDPDFDAEGTWLVRMDGGAVAIAMAGVDSNRVRAGKDDGHIDIEVVPEHRGVGIEEQLLDLSMAYLRSRKVGKALARTPVVDTWKLAFLKDNGFEEYYRIYVLFRAGRDKAPSAKLPDGYSFDRKLFRDCTDDEITAFVQLINESFFDHMNFAPELPERSIKWRDQFPDPILLTTVKWNGEGVGVCMSEESTSYNQERNVRAGWINILGVKLQFRRRGLARAMLADSINWIIDRGMDKLFIGVVSDNEKALDLYKAFGFVKDSESIWFQKPTRKARANAEAMGADSSSASR